MILAKYIYQIYIIVLKFLFECVYYFKVFLFINQVTVLIWVVFTIVIVNFS